MKTILSSFAFVMCLHQLMEPACMCVCSSACVCVCVCLHLLVKTKKVISLMLDCERTWGYFSMSALACRPLTIALVCLYINIVGAYDPLCL